MRWPAKRGEHRTGRGREAGRAPRRIVALYLSGLAALLSLSSAAQAQKVRVVGLSDVDFGMITDLESEARRAQSLCLFSSSGGGRYSVSAVGSGPASAFELSNGASSLPFDVEWNDSAGRTAGIALAPNVPLTGQTSSATHQFCNSGPVTSASLILVLRAAQLTKAREGAYSGSLTLLIAAE